MNTESNVSNSRTPWYLAAAAVTACFLAGCNTVDGAGEDLEAASENVEEAIED